MLHVVASSIDALSDHVKPADCIPIFGYTINKEGSPSPQLESRIEKGLELYQRNLAPKIIVSGGLEKGGWYEAIQMKK